MKRNFARVVVHVEDCNDHSPTFLRARYEANVSSQAPAGSQVVQVKALDQDVGSNAEISYAILTGEQQQRLRPRRSKPDCFCLRHASVRETPRSRPRPEGSQPGAFYPPAILSAAPGGSY